MACSTTKRIVLPPVCIPPGCPPPCCPPCCPPPCCPPPCFPSPCCPPPCCPPPCFPFMPGCPPCCPPCPMPCCGPKQPCCPKLPRCPCPPACCKPVNVCNCCGGKSTIICVPKGCSPPCYPQYCGPCCPPRCGPPCCPPGCGPSAGEEKPASFNNCNFYCSELPKGLRPPDNSMGCMDSYCLPQPELLADGLNRAAGDDQLAPVPRSTATANRSVPETFGKSSSPSSRQGSSRPQSQKTNTYSSYGRSVATSSKYGKKDSKAAGNGGEDYDYEYEESGSYSSSPKLQGKEKNGSKDSGDPKGKAGNKTTEEPLKAPPVRAEKRVKTISTAVGGSDEVPLPRGTLRKPVGIRFSTRACQNQHTGPPNTDKEVIMARGDVEKPIKSSRIPLKKSARVRKPSTKLEDSTKIEEVLCPTQVRMGTLRGAETKQMEMPRMSDVRRTLEPPFTEPTIISGLAQMSTTTKERAPRTEPARLDSAILKKSRCRDISTDELFTRQLPSCISSSTISAPPTNVCTALTARTSEHAISATRCLPVTALESNLRRSKSDGANLVGSQKDFRIFPLDGERIFGDDPGDCARAMEELHTALKSTRFAQKKWFEPITEEPLCVMTCLIERTDSERKKRCAMILPSAGGHKYYCHSIPSELTGNNSGTDLEGAELQQPCTEEHQSSSMRGSTDCSTMVEVKCSHSDTWSYSVATPVSIPMPLSGVSRLRSSEAQAPASRETSSLSNWPPSLPPLTPSWKTHFKFKTPALIPSSKLFSIGNSVKLPPVIHSLEHNRTEAPKGPDEASHGITLPPLPPNHFFNQQAAIGQSWRDTQCALLPFLARQDGLSLPHIQPIGIDKENPKLFLQSAESQRQGNNLSLDDPRTRRKRRARRVLGHGNANNGCSEATHPIELPTLCSQKPQSGKDYLDFRIA